ncbi:MAG: histidine--tRNA ligase [Alphaproteobacteria bacterium]|nr:histidine--tRNA ligase [Alphaproteobacteria bacterium]
MSGLQPVRGTRDILPDEQRRHRHIVEAAREVAERYGFAEIATPIFEFAEVFRRTLGETSDVVTKEMYTFTDRGGEEITLRPEYTAGIARAFISGGLMQQLPLKFFGHGPMFRYERPQKGRLRQFHQLDVEILGVPEPLADIEVIAVGTDILAALGVLDKTTLELNTLGDPASRDAYRRVLIGYFGGHRTKLSEDSRLRLERNPLRILDSKDQGDRELIAGAPLMSDHLNQQSADHFTRVREGLDALGIAYHLEPTLVRGLDYYTHTAFEFVTGELGAQGAVIAGGRYDGLIEAMGGPPTAGTGWAGGIERLAMMIGGVAEAPRPIVVVPLGETAESRALPLCRELRQAGLVIELTFRGNLSRRLKAANKLNGRAAVLIGEDELAREVATVRDLDSGAQTEVALAALAAHLARYR